MEPDFILVKALCEKLVPNFEGYPPLECYLAAVLQAEFFRHQVISAGLWSEKIEPWIAEMRKHPPDSARRKKV